MTILHRGLCEISCHASVYVSQILSGIGHNQRQAFSTFFLKKVENFEIFKRLVYALVSGT